MKGKFLVHSVRDYELYQITRVGEKNYICGFQKIDKDTLKDEWGNQYRFATEEDIKNYKLFILKDALKGLKITLKDIEDSIDKINNTDYLKLSDDAVEDLEYIIEKVKEILKDEQDND